MMRLVLPVCLLCRAPGRLGDVLLFGHGMMRCREHLQWRIRDGSVIKATLGSS